MSVVKIEVSANVRNAQEALKTIQKSLRDTGLTASEANAAVKVSSAETAAATGKAASVAERNAARGHVAAKGAERDILGVKEAMKGFIVATAAIFTVDKAIEFLKDSSKAAREEETSMKRLKVAVHNAGDSYRKHAEGIEHALDVGVKHNGFMRHDLIDSYAKLETSTKNTTKAAGELTLAQNIARGRNISLEAATNIVTKANLGNLGALKRLGIEVKANTKHHDAIAKALNGEKQKLSDLNKERAKELAGGGKISTQQKAEMELRRQAIIHRIEELHAADQHAKALDKEGNAATALSKLRQTYANQAEAFDKSSAGGLARLSAMWEDQKVKVGSFINQGVAKVATWLGNNLPQALARADQEWQKMKPAIESIIHVLARVAQSPFVRQFVDLAVRDLGRFVRFAEDMVHLVDALLHGRWGQAWAAAKDIVRIAISQLVDTARTFGDAMWQGLKYLGKKGIDGIKSGLSDLASAAGSKIDEAISWVEGKASDWLSAGAKFGEALISGLISAVEGAHIPLPHVNVGEGHTSVGPVSVPYPTFSVSYYQRGGKVASPMFMVGEEGPAHPEYVIATNPKYRNRNVDYWMQAGRALGVPGFATGGKTKETPEERATRIFQAGQDSFNYRVQQAQTQLSVDEFTHASKRIVGLHTRNLLRLYRHRIGALRRFLHHKHPRSVRLSALEELQSDIQAFESTKPQPPATSSSGGGSASGGSSSGGGSYTLGVQAGLGALASYIFAGSGDIGTGLGPLVGPRGGTGRMSGRGATLNVDKLVISSTAANLGVLAGGANAGNGLFANRRIYTPRTRVG